MTTEEDPREILTVEDVIVTTTEMVEEEEEGEVTPSLCEEVMIEGILEGMMEVDVRSDDLFTRNDEVIDTMIDVVEEEAADTNLPVFVDSGCTK